MINIKMNRVIDPKNSVLETAWKIENNNTICNNELRINIEFIHIKWDSFTQNCYNCYKDDKEIEKLILDIINTRGKLHNPHTGEGSLLIGTVEEIGNNFPLLHGEKIVAGDKVLCDTSIADIYVHIDEITKINCDFGVVYCKGYAITCIDSILLKIKSTIDTKAITLVFDKFYTAKGANEVAVAQKSESICLITKDPINAYIYLEAIKLNNPYAKKIYIIMDISLKGKFEGVEKTGIFSDTCEIIFMNIAKPLESYKKLIKENVIQDVDYVLLSENISGGEFLALLISKTSGNIFFSTIKNSYVNVTLNGDGMGKTVNLFSFNSDGSKFYEFALKLIEQVQEGINKYYKFLDSKQNTYENYSEKIYIDDTCNLNGFVFKSKVMANKVKQLFNVAKYDCNVIIEGETGTGKEMALEIIYSNSARVKGPCIKINCAAIQENLAESEFFGYEKGSFTGALANGKDGYFSMANNGILFLDEIDKLSINMQSKLLRVIQENSFYKVGGTEQINVDVRIICASNKSLKKSVEEGNFREDLFYRLNIVTVYIPSLRDRTDDIECLAEFFLKKYNDKYKINKSFDESTLDMMRRHDWPGNVRELENTVHRLIIESEDDIISSDILASMMDEHGFTGMLYNLSSKFDEEKLDFTDLVKELEKQIIKFALKKYGTTRKAAEYLNMSHTTLIRKKNNYGIHQDYELNRTLDYQNSNKLTKSQ